MSRHRASGAELRPQTCPATANNAEERRLQLPRSFPVRRRRRNELLRRCWSTCVHGAVGSEFVWNLSAARGLTTLASPAASLRSKCQTLELVHASRAIAGVSVGCCWFGSLWDICGALSEVLRRPSGHLLKYCYLPSEPLPNCPTAAPLSRTHTDPHPGAHNFFRHPPGSLLWYRTPPIPVVFWMLTEVKCRQVAVNGTDSS